MTGKCDDCPGLENLSPSEEISNELVKWEVWEGTIKATVEDTVDECFSQPQSLLPQFLEHTYIKRLQSAAFTDNIESNDGGTACIQLDFSENYSACHCEEPNVGKKH